MYSSSIDIWKVTRKASGKRILTTILSSICWVHLIAQHILGHLMMILSCPSQRNPDRHRFVAMRLNVPMDIRDSILEVIRSCLAASRQDAIDLCRKCICPWSCQDRQTPIPPLKDNHVLSSCSLCDLCVQSTRHPHLSFSVEPVGSQAWYSSLCVMHRFVDEVAGAVAEVGTEDIDVVGYLSRAKVECVDSSANSDDTDVVSPTRNVVGDAFEGLLQDVGVDVSRLRPNWNAMSV